MAKPEWYTGSDPTGEVATVIERTIERMDEHEADASDVHRLQSLLETEHEVNWRAFVLGLIGTIHYDLDEIPTATAVLDRAVASFKVYLETFDEVLSVYCQACYTLGSIFYDDRKYTEAAPYFLRCLPYMKEVYDEPYMGNVYAYLAVCLNWSSDTAASLVFAEAAAFSHHCDCESLERLMTAYANAGQIERASEVFEMMTHGCQDYEHFDRVLDFARRTFGEVGPVN